ncbi:MAG: hypothetical protein KGJ77_05530 [Acidobacteriota bacterium]|nr:hypothetical protein [Acidobacteriota bacterium]
MAALSLTAAACSSGPSVPSASESQAQITTAYKTLFNFADRSSESAKVALIQDGTALKSSLDQALASPLASAAQGASVSSVPILGDSDCTGKKVPSPCAHVKYSILGSGGTALLSNQDGYASYASGKWLVAKVTICQLLQEFYAASGNSGSPPGC